MAVGFHSAAMIRNVSRFGAKLRVLRKGRSLTQQELAEALGHSSHSYISEVEKGRKEPSIGMVLAVADLFEITTDALLRDNIRIADED